MEIFNVEKEDLKKCLDIYNYYVLNTTFSLEEDEVSLQEFSERFINISKDYPYICAKNDEGDILGYAYLSPFNKRSGYRYTADLSIYVKNEYRHLHVGKFLLDHILVKAKDLKLENIISIITSENLNSKKFHEKNGFSLEGNLKEVAKKFNRTLDVSFYRLHLK